MATPGETDPILIAPAPWKTRATSYIIPIWTSSSTASSLPSKAYSPLEAASPFASSAYGKPQPSMGMVMLVHYHETPVGPYDEMLLVPGRFTYPVEVTDKDGRKHLKTTHSARRITRIYVSQKHTTWNGRRNWNIPKHLATFSWTPDTPSPGLTTIKVYPHDTHTPYQSSESGPSNLNIPFFQCTIKSVPFTPTFPFRSSWLKLTGFDMTLVQPPLPDATKSTKWGELAGSAPLQVSSVQEGEDENNQGEVQGEGNNGRWVMVDDFYQSSDKASLVWIDMKQETQTQGQTEGGEAGSSAREKEHENFWPGSGRWVVGVKLEDGVIALGPGKTWATPRAVL